MQLAEKITSPKDLLKVDKIQHSAFFQECENKYGPLTEENFWKYREHLRATYEYAPVNFSGMPFHFIHFNQKDPNLIAFTANENVGKKDGKTLIKPGKYLAQYSSLDNEQIKATVTDYKFKYVPPKLHIVKDVKEAIHVYEKGPSSCMSGKTWQEDGGHPASAYVHGDLKLTYIHNKNGGIGARCILNTGVTPHTYFKLYGESALLKKALESEGYYKDENGFIGASFKPDWFDNLDGKKMIMPYVDSNHDTGFIHKNDRKIVHIGKTPEGEDEAEYLSFSLRSQYGFAVMPDVRECSVCTKLTYKEELTETNDFSICPTCEKEAVMLIVNEGSRHEVTLPSYIVKQAGNSVYIEYEGKWFNRNLLSTFDLFYYRRISAVIPISKTGLNRDGERYALAELLVMHRPSSSIHFRRSDQAGLLDNYIHEETFEFYTPAAFSKLDETAAEKVHKVPTFCKRTLKEGSKNHSSVPRMIEGLDLSYSIKDFLTAYLTHFDDGSYF